jgi:hypothetical protein
VPGVNMHMLSTVLVIAASSPFMTSFSAHIPKSTLIFKKQKALDDLLERTHSEKYSQ